jgi:hypothetical protein
MVAVIVSLLRRSILYYKMLARIKELHSDDLLRTYKTVAAQDALLKYDPVVGDSMKWLVPGFSRWKFWSGSRPTWIWEFLRSDECFGDPVLAELKREYREFRLAEFLCVSFCSSVLFIVVLTLWFQ